MPQARQKFYFTPLTKKNLIKFGNLISSLLIICVTLNIIFVFSSGYFYTYHWPEGQKEINIRSFSYELVRFDFMSEKLLTQLKSLENLDINKLELNSKKPGRSFLDIFSKFPILENILNKSKSQCFPSYFQRTTLESEFQKYSIKPLKPSLSPSEISLPPVSILEILSLTSPYYIPLPPQTEVEILVLTSPNYIPLPPQTKVEILSLTSPNYIPQLTQTEVEIMSSTSETISERNSLSSDEANNPRPHSDPYPTRFSTIPLLPDHLNNAISDWLVIAKQGGYISIKEDMTIDYEEWTNLDILVGILESNLESNPHIRPFYDVFTSYIGVENSRIGRIIQSYYNPRLIKTMERLSDHNYRLMIKMGYVEGFGPEDVWESESESESEE